MSEYKLGLNRIIKIFIVIKKYIKKYINKFSKKGKAKNGPTKNSFLAVF